MPTRGILERLSSGEFLVLDGATTTELEARGVSFPPPASSTLANIEAPDALKSLHADYLRVGADIITANNFSASPTVLDAIGKGSLWKDYAAAGIKIALQVRDELNPEAYVAGGVHPAGNYGDEFRQRIQLLADEGVDLILAEAVNTVDGCLGVAKTCADIDLPLFLGVGNLRESGDLADGTSVVELVSSLREYNVAALILMDSFPPSISAALPSIKDSFSGFFGAYPHCGLAGTKPGPFPHHEIEYSRYYSPSEFAGYAADWKSLGAQIIGGCCGTGPTHIATLVG